MPGVNLRGASCVSCERARTQPTSSDGSATTASADFVSNHGNGEEREDNVARRDGDGGKYIDGKEIQRSDGR